MSLKSLVQSHLKSTCLIEINHHRKLFLNRGFKLFDYNEIMMSGLATFLPAVSDKLLSGNNEQLFTTGEIYNFISVLLVFV